MTRGEHMKAVRLASGLTREELSNRSGVSVPAICLIERDRCGPRLSTLELLADALCISLDDYIGRVVSIG